MIKNEAQIVVTGWLNDVKTFDWGVALKLAVDVRKKNQQDEWETTDKTVYDVTADSVPNLDGVRQVTVTGRVVATATFEKRDGSTGSAIRVRATEVVVTVDDREAPQKITEAAVLAQWPKAKMGKPVSDAPF